MTGLFKSVAQQCRAMIVTVMAASLCVSSCSPPAPIGSSQWLLGSLQRLADEGALFKPVRVEEVLHLHLGTSQEEAVRQSSDCSNRGANSSLLAIKHIASPAWLHPTTEGVRGMRIPAFFINPEGVSGEPAFSYTEFRAVKCNDRDSPLETQEASLSINGLPAFACFQRADLERKFGVKGQQATDGVDLVTYDVPQNDQRAASLQFTFRAGAPCALGATIRQDYKLGHRYQRAWRRWRTCTDTANRQFCQANGTFSWTDSDKVSAMQDVAFERCGTVGSAYMQEPVSGLRPPVVERTFSNGPCRQSASSLSAPTSSTQP